MLLYLHILIVFSIFGVLSALGHDISSAMHTAYNNIYHFANAIANPGITGAKLIISGTQSFFGSFVGDVVDPVFNFIDQAIITVTQDLLATVATVMSWVLGIPEGFIVFFQHSLGGLGILGFPATMIIIGIGIVIIVAVSLAIVKVIQYLVEVL